MKLLRRIISNKAPIFTMLGYWLLHVVLVVNAVPVANILPASFAACALTAMSLSFVLAARWRFVERLFGGRDKAYIFHRWLGYGSVVSMAFHWALATPGEQVLIPFLSEFAADIAIPASITLIALCALSAIKAMHYHLWIWTHRLLGPIYILLVFHSFFSPIPLMINSIAWHTLLGISFLGITAWFYSLRRLFIQDQPYEVTAIDLTSGNLDIRLKPLAIDHQWQPGQFTNFMPNIEGFEEEHPFSFASASKEGGEARFIIRALGDFSCALPQAIKIGDTVTLSKPAGRFIPRTKPSKKPQVWVAGGVGITPFLSALDAFNEHSPETTLLYCFKERDSAIELETIQAYAKRLTNLNVVLLCLQQGQLLTADSFKVYLDANYQKADLFICGPEGLKDVAMKGWQQWNRKGKVHHEHFDFRAALDIHSL